MSPVSHPITTTGTTPVVTTTQNSGESVVDWVDRHDKDVDDATPNGNTLTTTYTSSQGLETTVTTRAAGESDDKFRERHQTDYLELMATRPPIP